MAISVETFFLNPDAQGTLQAQIQQMIAEGILSGRFHTGEKLPSVWAAFANASMCHGVDFDDTHVASIVHTGAPIVSAALAVAEARGASGKDLILAAVIGYEIAVRVGMCIMPSHYEYWMPSATCTTLGASALTAKLR